MVVVVVVMKNHFPVLFLVFGTMMLIYEYRLQGPACFGWVGVLRE